MNTKFWILLCMVVWFIILPIINDFVIPYLETKMEARKKKRYINKYHTCVPAEVVGEFEKTKVARVYSVLNLFFTGIVVAGVYQVYCPVVKYTIGDCTYEVPTGKYTHYHIKRGNKATVIYNPANPFDFYAVFENVEQGVIGVAMHPIPLIAWWKARSYKLKVVGEVVGIDKRLKRNKLLIPLFGPGMDEEMVYSAIVRYTVGDNVYEVNTRNYSGCLPIIGRKALVWCRFNDYEQAYVSSTLRYRKGLQVRKKDENYAYCAYGLRRNIKLPLEMVDECVKPGHYLIYRHGLYQLKQPEENKKSYLEAMAEMMGGKL